MYAREIGGVEHTFGVSGKLIMNALVMYDHQTKTLWSQFLGQGVKGPMRGVDLNFVPVTWNSWREAHPDTVVLDKLGRYQSDSYDSYYVDRSAGVLGESRRDHRLDRKELVVGVGVAGRTKAYLLSRLLDQPVLNDTVAGQDVLVFLDRGTYTDLVYERLVEGRALTFRMYQDGTGTQTLLADEETGSRWRALT